MSQIHRKRRGNAMIVALTLLPIMGFGALSVDIGMQRTTSLQIQSAAEAGSLAGSARLNGSVAGITAAEDYALEIANLNHVYGSTVFEAADVEAGIYNSGNNTFTPFTNQDPGTVNAVRVSDTRTVEAILSKAAGVTTLGAEGAAISIQPRGGVPAFVDCFLPVAIPSCTFLQQDAADGTVDNIVSINPPPVKVLMNGGGDTGGFAVPSSSSPASNTTVGELFADGCAANTASTNELMDANGGVLQGASGVITAINDDNPFQGQNPPMKWENYDADGPANEPIQITWPPTRGAGIIQGAPANGGASPVDDGSPPWGRTVAGAVPIVTVPNTGINNCSGFGWSDDFKIVGWSYGYIFDADQIGNDKGLYIQMDFLNTYDIGYGQCTDNTNDGIDDCIGNVTGTYPSSLVL